MEWSERDVRTWKRADRDGIIYVVVPGTSGFVSSGQTVKRKAVEWALLKASGGATPDVTLGVYAKDFFIPGLCPRIRLLEEAGDRNVPQTWYNFRQVLDDYILPRWGKTMLAAIRAKPFFEWLASAELVTVKEFNGIARPLSAGQRNRIHNAMNHIFEQAIFDGIIDRNPLLSVPWIKKRGPGRGTFSVEELGKLFPADDSALVAVWGTLAWAAFFSVLRDSAMRPGEELALTWSDWHPAHLALIVSKGVDQLGKIGPLKTAKRGVSKKAVLVSPRSAELLKKLREARDAKPEDLIFPASRFEKNAGATMKTAAANRAFLLGLKRAGVPRVREGVQEMPRTEYCLRHTRNTELRTGQGDAATRLLMGHTEGSSMTDLYDHPEDADLIIRAKAAGGRG